MTVGHSGAEVWRLSGPSALFVKVAARDGHPDPGSDLLHEAACTRWLREQGLPAPEVADCGEHEGTAWLVTAALPGRSLAEPWPARLRYRAVHSLARFACRLHALPLADCPFTRDLSVTVPQAAAAVAAGAVDADDFDAHRAGRTPESLAAELERTRPRTEDPVVCHGDLCLPNVLLDPGTLEVTGVVDLGRLGVADRHQDLALACRSRGDGGLNPQYGPAAPERFLRAYGIPADPARLEYYTLLDEFF